MAVAHFAVIPTHAGIPQPLKPKGPRFRGDDRFRGSNDDSVSFDTL